MELDRGVLIGSAIEGTPAAEAGILGGDVLVELAGVPVDIRFAEQVPEFNLRVAELAIGEPVAAVVLRDGEEVRLDITPSAREEVLPDQHEFKEWGITGRNLSFIIAKEMKRESTDGVLVTSVQTGGPAGEAKPSINSNDVILEVAGQPVGSIEDLRSITDSVTEGADEPVPTLVVYERETERLVTVVEVGIKEIEDPGLEVKKAWLPIESQVLTFDIAEKMGDPDLRGFIVTHVYRGSTADTAGLQVGDKVLAVDGMALTASRPEDYEELPELIRQYRVGTEAELTVLRQGERMAIPVELVRSPESTREMERYRDEAFEFTVRNVSFFDRAEEQWPDDQPGVIVEQVLPGGWAALGELSSGDLLVKVNDTTIDDVDQLEEVMDGLVEREPEAVVFQVLRGIHTIFLELQPRWEEAPDAEDDATTQEG
jgi:S1-C subfamily serine protease